MNKFSTWMLPDLLIIDEARRLCIRRRRQPVPGSYGAELVKGARARGPQPAPDPGPTATQRSRKDKGFHNLLALLQPNLEYVDLAEMVQGREVLARHFVQRRRGDIRVYIDETTPFPEDRLSRERSYALSRPYKELFDDVLQYARETVRDPEGGQLRQRVRYWSALALLRALASSPRGGRHPPDEGGQPRLEPTSLPPT